MQGSADMDDVAASSSSQKDKGMIFPENYDTSMSNNNNYPEQQLLFQGGESLQLESHAPATELQPLVPIAGSQVKDYPKCFVQIQPCYPFGMANLEEKMLVITPDDNLSLYADAVVCLILIHLCSKQAKSSYIRILSHQID
jgi:hypothetical protein